MNQMIGIMINQNVQEQIDSLGDKDVFIRPELGTIESGDFKRGKEAAERGEQAARKKENELRRYSLTEEEYAVFLAKHQKKEDLKKEDLKKEVSTIKVGSVTVEGLSRVSPEAVASKLKIKTGDTLDAKTLRDNVGLIYGMGDFERVDLKVKPHGDAYDIILRPTEKSWGPNYLRVGVNLESDFNGDSDFNILADYTMRWLNRLGAEWKTEVQIGSTKKIYSEFYQPLVASRSLFIAPHIEWKQKLFDVYQGDDIIAEYRVRNLEGGIDFGVQPWTYGEVRIGYLGGITKPKIRTGTLDLPEDKITRGALRGQLLIDQVDNVNFPRKGYAGYITFYSSMDELGADDNYNKMEVSLLKAFTYKKYTMLGSLKYGTYIGKALPFYDEFYLGGFLSLSGLHQDQLRGQQFGLGRMIFYWNASNSLLGNFYLGGSLETGNAWTRGEHIDLNDLRLAGSVFIGYDMPLGPFYLGYGHADEGHDAVYLYLGRTF
jgi:NTE family protein